MNEGLKENKRIIRAFMREHYTDERLAMLLAHARDGKLAYFSCCCFVGIPTADHALRGRTIWGTEEHYVAAKALPGATFAEFAYAALSNAFGEDEANPQRVRRLIPIVKAEMRRRSRMLKSERLDEFYGDADQSERCAELS